MATAKPRITITLESHQHDLLRRLSVLTGQSMSSIVIDLVGTVAPVLERVAVAMEAAKRAQAGVKENLRRVAEESEQQFLPHVEAAMGQLDIFVTQVAQMAEEAAQAIGAPGAPCDGRGAATQGAAGAPPAVSDPRPVITGVRSGRKGPQGASAGKGEGGRSPTAPARSEGPLQASPRRRRHAV